MLFSQIRDNLSVRKNGKVFLNPAVLDVMTGIPDSVEFKFASNRFPEKLDSLLSEAGFDSRTRKHWQDVPVCWVAPIMRWASTTHSQYFLYLSEMQVEPGFESLFKDILNETLTGLVFSDSLKRSVKLFEDAQRKPAVAVVPEVIPEVGNNATVMSVLEALRKDKSFGEITLTATELEALKLAVELVYIDLVSDKSHTTGNYPLTFTPVLKALINASKKMNSHR